MRSMLKNIRIVIVPDRIIIVVIGKNEIDLCIHHHERSLKPTNEVKNNI